MTSIPNRLRSCFSTVRYLAAISLVTLLLVGPATTLSASTTSLAIKLFTVTGSATNTVTSLDFINDTTIRIESEQVGHLTHFGDFTGHFSYTAYASPTSIVLVGHATLTNTSGEELFLTASILELGADYPRSVAGTLTVTGGTGHYAGATGSIALTGTDQESLTDTFYLNGALVTVH